MTSRRLTASNPCIPCGQRLEQGASPYIGKVALLHNGMEITIKMVDPNNGRKFCGKHEAQDFWFTLKDIAGLRG